MSPGAWLMIHELSTFNEGKLSEVKDYTKWLERAQIKMEKILAERSTLSLASIKRRTAKGKDWWLDADEAVKYGFADGVAFTAGTIVPGT
jgi:ATP-dependent protease ClpP protease subunit